MKEFIELLLPSLLIWLLIWLFVKERNFTKDVLIQNEELFDSYNKLLDDYNSLIRELNKLANFVDDVKKDTFENKLKENNQLN